MLWLDDMKSFRKREIGNHFSSQGSNLALSLSSILISVLFFFLFFLFEDSPFFQYEWLLNLCEQFNNRYKDDFFFFGCQLVTWHAVLQFFSKNNLLHVITLFVKYSALELCYLIEAWISEPKQITWMQFFFSFFEKNLDANLVIDWVFDYLVLNKKRIKKMLALIV